MPATLEQSLDSIEESNSDEYCIIVFNNNHNTFEEVIAILSIALKIDAARAEMYAWDIHLMGLSRVYYGSVDDCKTKAAIIGTIGVKTEVSTA